MPRLIRLAIVAVAVSMVLVACVAVPDHTPKPGPTITLPTNMTFPDLDTAVERGAIDPQLVTSLRAGNSVDAFVILDGTEVAAAYGDGSEADVDKATAVVAALRQRVIAAIDPQDVQVLQTYDLVPGMLVRIVKADAALRLLNLPEVLSITQDRENRPSVATSLPRINQPQVAAMGLVGKGVGVAVLDSGADFTHSAFGPCTKPGLPAATCRVPIAFDAAADDGAMDDDGHGTNVAAIVAAVAPGARIIPIDVFAGKTASDHDILTGINWVLKFRVDYNIRAVNMSLGSNKTYHTSPCGDTAFWRNPYGLPFALLRQAGALPVVGSGNDATLDGTFRDGITYPACTGNSVAVGATYSGTFGSITWGSGSNTTCTDTVTAADLVTCFSQDGPQVDVLAPGAVITAGGRTKFGTSQAAPHVSGAIAVLAKVRPTATAEELESYLRASSTVITDPRSGRSHPRLDLMRALNAAAPVANDNRDAATALPGWGGQLDQMTWTATKEPGEPAHVGNSGGASVWFRWTALRAGEAFFTTGGSDFDTLIAAYRINPSGSLIQLAANNDFGGQQTSLIQLTVGMGDAVLVAVDGVRPTSPGAFPAAGRLRLTWNLPNDFIAEALPISSGSTVNGANIGATHESGEPHHCGDLFSTASVWYKWTPNVNASARLQASGTQALCAAVYRASSHSSSPWAPFDQLTVIAAADDLGPDPINFTFPAASANTYWIAVDGVSREKHCDPTTGQCWYWTPAGTFVLDLATPRWPERVGPTGDR